MLTANRPTATPSPRLAVQRVNARDYRAGIIRLYARHGNSDVARLFDWYYQDIGQGQPASWILAGSESSDVRGLCTVTPRLFRWNTEQIKAGVLGNFLIDESSRGALSAVSVVRAAKSLVNTGEVDLLLGVPNELATPVLLKMGFRVIGRMRTFAQVFRSRELLGHRFGTLGVAASPFLDALSFVKRAISTGAAKPGSRMRVIELSENQLLFVNTREWTTPAHQLALESTGEFLGLRFLAHPTKRYRAFGIHDAAVDRIVAVIAAHVRPGRLHISHCSADTHVVSDAEALLAFCDTDVARQSTVWVTTLERSPLQNLLAHSGLYRVPRFNGGWSERPLLGFWRPDHHLADHFASPASWNLYIGFNDV